ncbi:MAG: formate/nitrite transporter family protein [Clostridia bacterium]|nr:formate/nitrite transporter family protein [Clostridia bacterium]
MLKDTLSGICAGILIAIGGSIFLAVSPDNKYLAAVLFSVALLCICYKGYALFTGKVGYILQQHDKPAVSALLLSLLGNTIGCVAFGKMLRAAMPALGATADTLCQGKLDSQSFLQTLVRGLMCGILMYLAVSIFREKNTPLGILFCIPVFILSGFEHSIADIFYFAASGIVSLRACGFLWTVILGNAIGGVLLPALQWANRPTVPEKAKEKEAAHAK